MLICINWGQGSYNCCQQMVWSDVLFALCQFDEIHSVESLGMSVSRKMLLISTNHPLVVEKKKHIQFLWLFPWEKKTVSMAESSCRWGLTHPISDETNHQAMDFYVRSPSQCSPVPKKDHSRQRFFNIVHWIIQNMGSELFRIIGALKYYWINRI